MALRVRPKAKEALVQMSKEKLEKLAQLGEEFKTGEYADLVIKEDGRAVVKDGARAREYEGALNWLSDANLIYKVYNVNKTAIPLKAYTDLSCFKIYLNDVGLLRRMSNIDSKIVVEGNKLFEEFKGAFAENYVLNMLNIIYENTPFSVWDSP